MNDVFVNETLQTIVFINSHQRYGCYLCKEGTCTYNSYSLRSCFHESLDYRCTCVSPQADEKDPNSQSPSVWNAIWPNIQHLECTMQHLECTIQPYWLRFNIANTHQHGKYAPTCLRIRTNMANTLQPAFVNIIWPDIEECKLVRICVCMLMRICSSLPSHFKGRTYGEGETPCHVIHTRMESVFNGRTGI